MHGEHDGTEHPIEVKNAIKKFRGDFEDYIREKRTTVGPAEALMAH